MHLPFNPTSIFKFDTAKRYMYILVILSIVVCAGASSKSIFSSEESGYEPYLYYGSSSNSVTSSNLTQEEDFHYIDNSAVKRLRVTGPKISRGPLSIANTVSLNTYVGTLLGILSDPGRFSPYILIYSSPHLRSPPYPFYV